MHKKRWLELSKIDRVEGLIRKNGLKKGAFCAMLGRGRTWIDDWKRGRSLPDETTVSQIAEVLHTTAAYLMDKTDDPTPLPVGAWEADMGNVAPLLGTVRAGLPMYAEENIEGYIPITQTDGAKYFWLRVRGDSMSAAGIADGDEILVRQQPVVENGQIAVVLVNGDEATVKHFSQSGNIVSLMPQSFSPEYQAQIYNTEETPVSVVGLVIECRKKFG